MPDIDPATALAPPPGWTPPQPASPTPMDVNPATMNGGVPQLPAATQPTVQQATPTAPQTTPASQDPEMVAGDAHQTWLGRLLDNANQEMSKFLGGDQTIHVTKHQDGTFSVTHEASTTGERWARVAQAVLGGAASGMAAGQGPGGPARAAAAGIATGLNQAPQQLQQANQEAAQMNQQQLAKANMALLNQKVTMGTLQMRQLGIAMTDADVARANNNAAYLLANPANTKLGEITDMSQLPGFAAKNADLIKQHANGQIHTQTEIGADGKPHVAVYLVDQNWMDQKNDKPYTYSRLKAGKTLNDPMTLEDVTVPPGIHTNSELMATHESEDAKIAAYKLKLAEIDSKGDKAETNPLAMQLRANTTTDPAERQRLETTLNQDQQRRTQIARESRPVAPGTEEGYQAIAADLNGANPKLDISQIRTRKDWPQIYGAARQYAIDNGLPAFDPATASAKYKARTTAINEFTNKKEADQIQSLNNFFGHAQDLMDVTQKLRNPTDMPILNTPINKLDTEFAGDPRLALLKPKITVVRKEYQAFLENNRALHNEDITAGNEMLNDNMTPAQMENAVKGFSGAAITRAATTAQRAHIAGFDEIIPHILNSNSRRTIANLGLQDHLNKVWQDVGGAPTAAPAAAAPTAAAPQAATPTAPAAYTPGVNSAQYPIMQKGETKIQWNGKVWATLP